MSRPNRRFPKASSPAEEWARKTQSRSYIRSAKRKTTSLVAFVRDSRQRGANASKPPSRAELRATAHSFLEVWEFSDRRRGRREDSPDSSAPIQSPTTSLLY